MELRRVLRWEDPPPAAHGPPPHVPRKNNWAPAVADLQAKPGAWGLIAEQVPRGEATTARYCATRYGCQVAVRGPADGPNNVYARWPEDAS